MVFFTVSIIGLIFSRNKTIENDNKKKYETKCHLITGLYKKVRLFVATYCRSNTFFGSVRLKNMIYLIIKLNVRDYFYIF